MWYLIVSFPDLCRLSYFVYLVSLYINYKQNVAKDINSLNSLCFIQNLLRAGSKSLSASCW